jgi:hypothetical protein
MPRQECFGAGQECTQLGAKSDDDQRIWNGDGVRRTHPKERPAVRRTVVHLATAPSRTPGRG